MKRTNFFKLNRIIITIIIFLCSYLSAHTEWITQSSGTTEHLQSVYFVNDLTGWAVGYAGKILKTVNGGTNWIAQVSPTANPLLSVYFASTTAGWAVGALGEIIATGNGGTTWTIQTSGTTSQLNSVYFISASTGWAAGGFMTVLKTTNSGSNWISMLSSDLTINSVFFTSSSTGYIAGNGFLYKTTNGGLNWSAPISNPAWYLFSVHFPAGSTTTGYTVGMGSPSPPILKSTDSGNNWSILPVPLGNALTSVYFTNISTGWAVGWIGTITHTTNGGVNWSDQSSGTSNSLRSVFFVNSSTGWAVGDLGTIVKTVNGGITGVKTISNSNPGIFILSQNYPNPFNPKTIINYQLPTNNYVTLKIYDLTGKEIATLVNEEQRPGEYEVEFDASSLPSGVYFYRLTAGEHPATGQVYSATKKMILLK